MSRGVPQLEPEPCKYLAQGERQARHELERRARREFTDDEWRRMQGKLKEFYSILQEWEQRKRDQRTPGQAP